MGPATSIRDLSARDLEPVLAVASKLAAFLDLDTMLGEVASAARQVLQADRASVWLHDATSDELVLLAAGDIGDVRIPMGRGLLGACARLRQLINVPDCYADERFDPSTDLRTGYRTQSLLSLPLIDHREVLVGVLQVLNSVAGEFDRVDEALATVLAAQCAVALQRARMMAGLLEGELLRQELEIARSVQVGTLPATMPAVPGYDVYGRFEPSGHTGGDTFDLQLVERKLLVVLGDATGHGMGPALTVTQMQSMLRMAFRLGADLDTAFRQVNNLLAETLPDDRFICAFIGLLDPDGHRLHFHSGGHGPILVLRAATGDCEVHRPTSFPVAAMALPASRAAAILDFAPGDMLVLISDGLTEYRNLAGEEYGASRVHQVLRQHHRKTMEQLAKLLLESVRAFAGGAPQEDDVTVVLVKREAAEPPEVMAFERRPDSLEAIFQFIGAAFSSLGVDASLRQPVEFAVDELFTNVVRHGRPNPAPVHLTLARIPGGVEVTLIDPGAAPFDITRVPDADIHLPLEQREPGGLGLHLVRRMVDSLEYEHQAELRQTRITFRKTQTGASASGSPPKSGGGHAHD